MPEKTSQYVAQQSLTDFLDQPESQPFSFITNDNSFVETDTAFPQNTVEGVI